MLKVNELGKKQGLKPPVPWYTTLRMQHHPGMGQYGNLHKWNGINSYNHMYSGAGFHPQSVSKAANASRNAEILNPVQGPIGKRARLRREGKY